MRGLEEIRCQHGVFVWANALLGLLVGRKRGEIRIFDDLEFVLLIGIEEAGEGRGREMKGFGYEGSECGR